MKDIIQEIKKRPKLKNIILILTGKIKKIDMFFCNKIIGVNKRKAVFISFNGKSYSDNPRAISEKLKEMCSDFEIVWLFNRPEEKREIVPKYVKCVKNNSLKALKELATAKFWVDNFCKPIYIYKNKRQIYIQTWHGDRGFKKILYNSPFISSNYKILESKICDLAVSGSRYGNMQYRKAFRYGGEILQKGTPRNDILIRDRDNQELIKKIKKSLRIESGTKVLLYAPTLRREAVNGAIEQDIGGIDLEKIIKVLEEKTNIKWICLIRAHSAVKGLQGIPETNKIIDVTDYEDMNELLLISDMLITDYSSCAGDFALLERPIILFQSDRKLYLEKDRALYFDIDNSPFIVAMGFSDLIDIIKNIKMIDFEKNCKEILEFYGTNETGESSKNIVEFIISKSKEEMD